MRAPGFLVALSILIAADARADDVLEVAASTGYGLPIGAAERGAKLGDTTFGLVPIEADVTFRIARALGIGVHGRYGAGIPTLCASTADCKSSVGRDAVLAVRARYYAPRLGAASPYLDTGVGYEWFLASLVDKGASSTRSYRGPVLSAEIGAPFRLGSRWTLGPAIDASIGTFTARDLETNASAAGGAIPARTVHAWFTLGARVGLQL